METVQHFIFDAGWIFFAAWGAILAAVGGVVFRSDIAPRLARSHKRHSA